MKRNQNVNASVAAPNAYTTNAYAASDRTAAHALIPGGRPVITATNLIMDYAARRKTANHVGTTPMSALANTAPALNNVSFRLNVGETVAIMGPSGSGKSTLLHILAGIDLPTSGQVTYHVRNNCAYELTGISDQDRTMLRSQATDTAMLWMERLGLKHLASHRPGEMSGGQMQRVAIARALATNPSVVFADEPTGALDQATGREVMGILMDAAQANGSAVVVVTHDPNVAAFCSRTVTMRDGRLLGGEQ